MFFEICIILKLIIKPRYQLFEQKKVLFIFSKHQLKHYDFKVNLIICLNHMKNYSNLFSQMFIGHSYNMLKRIHTVQTCELLCNILFKMGFRQSNTYSMYIVEYKNIM